MIKLPKLAIFDMDGLIFDTERLFMEEKGKILASYGYPARKEDYIQTIGLAGRQLRNKQTELYGPDYPADEISQKTRAALNIRMETSGPEVKPGIRTLLRWFRMQGVTCCVASSTRHEYVERYLTLAGLISCFAYLIGGEEVTRSKPEPDIFLAACARGQFSPADALVLEDSDNGIRAAYAAGIPVVCIPDLKQPVPENAEKAAVILPSADQLIPLLRL